MNASRFFCCFFSSPSLSLSFFFPFSLFFGQIHQCPLKQGLFTSFNADIVLCELIVLLDSGARDFLRLGVTEVEVAL